MSKSATRAGAKVAVIVANIGAASRRFSYQTQLPPDPPDHGNRAERAEGVRRPIRELGLAKCGNRKSLKPVKQDRLVNIGGAVEQRNQPMCARSIAA